MEEVWAELIICLRMGLLTQEYVSMSPKTTAHNSWYVEYMDICTQLREPVSCYKTWDRVWSIEHTIPACPTYGPITMQYVVT